jgi:transposase InsO family protein
MVALLITASPSVLRTSSLSPEEQTGSSPPSYDRQRVQILDSFRTWRDSRGPSLREPEKKRNGLWLLRGRRNQLRHPKRKARELVATGPSQVWSRDTTKLRGPTKWIFYYLYVILDIFSRCVVAWMVAERESSSLAARLLGETYLLSPSG